MCARDMCSTELQFIKAIADLGTSLTKQPCKQEVQYIMGADFRTACIFFSYDKTSRITEGMEGTTPNVWPTATVSISNDCPGTSSDVTSLVLCTVWFGYCCTCRSWLGQMIEKDHYDIDSVSSDSITDIEQLQYVLTVQRQCTKLTFTIGTSSSSVILNLTSSIE